ncbi:MAG: ATP-binding cassette domain-containing protein [Clostridiales bacterium]|nr:ATP-binding cassette domain-containing protein [Clostridiales bacterium]
MKKNVIKIMLPLAFWLGVWQIVAVYVDFALLLPTPVAVGRTLLELAAAGAFWKSIFLSLGRVFSGLFLGCFLGCFLAFLTFRFPFADLLLSPAIRVIRATPVVSFILLVYLWIARRNIPGCISALMVLPIMWNSIRLGLDSVDRKLLEMAAAYRFGKMKTIRLIWLPSLRPYFSSGLTTGLGLAWKSGVAAEVICPPRYAIGTELSKAKTALQSPELYAWTVVLILLSLTMEAVLRRLLNLRKAKEACPKSSDREILHEEVSYQKESGKNESERVSDQEQRPAKKPFEAHSVENHQTDIDLMEKLCTANLHMKEAPIENLYIENLTFSYGEKRIMSQFNMVLSLDGLTAISGPSGCGKTTLLRILAGLEKRAEGSILLNIDRHGNENGNRNGDSSGNNHGNGTGIGNCCKSIPLHQKRISILFQEDRLLPWRTVKEHIMDVRPDQVDEWLAFAELEEVKDAYPAELSGGQARRLALARCCALGGELMLLDEPFAGVDTDRRVRILERLKKMGIPVILATHEPDVVAACGYVVYLDGPPLRVKNQSVVNDSNSR